MENKSRAFSDIHKPYMNNPRTWVIDYVNQLNPNLVIDAGCGRNQYKNKIPNLIGIDPGDYQNVDMNVSILDAPFEPECADVVMAIGSIQFVSFKFIRLNVSKIVDWVKPSGHIVMRVTMRTDDTLKRIRFDNKVKLVPWTEELIKEITELNNLKLVVQPFEEKVTYLKKPANNLTRVYPAIKKYWVWQKPERK